MQDPKNMLYPEIIGEIQSIRALMRQKGQRIYELSRILQDRVRKQGADEYSSRYLAFVNANTRFVGSVEQSIQRTTTFDRVVLSIQKEQKEAEEREKQKEVRAKRREVTSADSPLADLSALFGQEMIDDATR